ncbi:FHA domain-containing protein [Rhodocaloribacter litoris]|uniref:Swt1 family HEPN domain-containing protein n=1 Tax=Rhodocaloribacter litoris TaxID=2558931 RepID=UPI001423F71C|nr:Swt1 family HEPN domain-containing protein [Rhodocaloribacter litoris]QXD14061.1 FHA domain-containing protein [Rhodocaloribacter litoris]
MEPANAQLTHRARVGDALDLLHRVLHPYIEREMRAVYGDRWEREARGVLHGKPIETWDTSDLLTLLYTKFHPVFRDIGHEGRSWVSLLREIRKKWAHQGTLSLDETRRTLETAILLLRAIGAEPEAERLEPHVLDLMRSELEERLAPGEDAAWMEKAREAIEARKEAVGRSRDRTPGEGVRALWEAGVRRIRTLFHRPPSEPLEVRRTLLDAIEHAAEPYRRDFPFNRLVVHVCVPDERTRQRYEAALERQREPFAVAVLRRLADARIPVPASLHVSWRFHRTPPKKLEAAFEAVPYHIEWQRRRPAGTATLKVLRGRAHKEQYVIRGGAPVTLGRQAEVTDARGRVVWRNAVAFLDYEDDRLTEEEREVHATISRVHARIEYDETEDAFRLYDAQSTCGTSVVREGFLVPFQVRQQPVPLQDGDLIYLGKACLRFNLGRPSGRAPRRGRPPRSAT